MNILYHDFESLHFVASNDIHPIEQDDKPISICKALNTGNQLSITVSHYQYNHYKQVIQI